MKHSTRYLGLDVQAETITAAIAEGRGRVRSLGKFPNRPEAVRKLTRLNTTETFAHPFDSSSIPLRDAQGSGDVVHGHVHVSRGRVDVPRGRQFKVDGERT